MSSIFRKMSSIFRKKHGPTTIQSQQAACVKAAVRGSIPTTAGVRGANEEEPPMTPKDKQFVRDKAEHRMLEEVKEE